MTPGMQEAIKLAVDDVDCQIVDRGDDKFTLIGIAVFYDAVSEQLRQKAADLRARVRMEERMRECASRLADRDVPDYTSDRWYVEDVSALLARGKES